MPDPWAWGSLPEQRVTLWIVKRERNRVSHCTLQAEGGDSLLLPLFSESLRPKRILLAEQDFLGVAELGSPLGLSLRALSKPDLLPGLWWSHAKGIALVESGCDSGLGTSSARGT